MERSKRDRIVHELGNHLGIVLGFTELVIDTMPEGDARRADLEEVRGAAKKAVALLDDLSNTQGT